MNYKSQLKGWAVDRVIELYKVPKFSNPAADPTLDTLMADAEKLAGYAYVPREDLESTAKDLFELVRNSPAGESSIDALIGTLEHIKEDRIRNGVDKMAEAPTQETVQ